MKFKWIIFSFLAVVFLTSAGFTVIQQTKPQNQDPVSVQSKK